MSGEGAKELAALLFFIDEQPLTDRLANLERELTGKSTGEVTDVLNKSQVLDQSILNAAILLAQRIGRIHDIVHALGILSVLPKILRPEEVLSRPSLAAGNDHTRPFDVETDQRIAEFKFAQWKGSDAYRKKTLFKDLVHLAADESGRNAQLYVRGEMPRLHLQTSRGKARGALSSWPKTQILFESKFGSLDQTVADFTDGPAREVEVVDLAELLPEPVADW